MVQPIFSFTDLSVVQKTQHQKKKHQTVLK